jgi:hypothetical protein
MVATQLTTVVSYTGQEYNEKVFPVQPCYFLHSLLCVVSSTTWHKSVDEDCNKGDQRQIYEKLP